ncbi:MAG: esterase-like activity of phytase family protein [Aquabacterium sp.]|nr:esterase-like activity of phytase family protein [Aquabacterium sp.]
MRRMGHWVVWGCGVVWVLGACSGSGEAPRVDARLLDGAVQGVRYAAEPSGISGTTSAEGRLSCAEGDRVTFTVGGVVLGQAVCAATITPIDWAGTDKLDAPTLTNRLLWLQLLDEDDTASNGIRITDAVAQALQGRSLDFGAAPVAFDAAAKALLPAQVNDVHGQPYGARVIGARRALAVEHFEGTLATALGRRDTSATNQVSAGGEVRITKYTLAALASQGVPYEGDNAAAKRDFPTGFALAVGSGLAYKGTTADGTLEFWGITDRGPNGDTPSAPVPGSSTNAVTKMFPAPSFAPTIGVIALGRAGASITATLPLKVDAVAKATGRPLPAGAVGASSGIIQKRYAPGNAPGSLPAVLKHRRANRGMEGLALDAETGHLLGFLQSPIDPLDAAGKSIETIDTQDRDRDGKSTDKVKVRDFAPFARWLDFDPATEQSRLYAYPLDYPLAAAGGRWDRNRTGSAKLGDLVALGQGRYIVIEQGADQDGKVRNFLMLVQRATDVTDIAGLGYELEQNAIDGATASAVAWTDVVPLKKTLLLDLNAAGWMAEKAEGLTLVDAQTLALINDNDFGLRSILFDAVGKEVAGDPTECTVDAAGAIVADGKCASGAVGVRVARGSDTERPTRVWLLRFPKALTAYTVP